MWKLHKPNAAIALALTLFISGEWIPASQAAPPEVQDAITWYDTLGYPDAKDLPYVRVATGRYTISGNQPPENTFTEGFLLHDEAGAFTVFICSISEFKDHFHYEPYPQLTTVQFLRKTEVPAHQRVDFHVLDFKTIASEVLGRVSAQAARNDSDFRRGRGLPHRARIFAFARACEQKAEPEIASVLMEIAANMPNERTGKVEPHRLRAALQRQIGDAVLQKAEDDFCDPAISWQELLKPYENFETQFSANSRIAYAKESAELLRKMIAENAAHHPKPLEQMSPAEQVAENIYRLHDLGTCFWIMNQHYPIDAVTPDGKRVITPVHRLTDLGNVAVPQLIEALDDRRFTRCAEQNFHGRPTVVMRVGDVARGILDHLSGRNFYPDVRERTSQEAEAEEAQAAALSDAGLPVPEWRPIILHTAKEKAEAWWKEMQGTGEKQTLIKMASEGGHEGITAARKLVEKYPDAALDAIQAGIRTTREEGYRGEFVEVAGLLPEDKPVAFLRAQLSSEHGTYSQVSAAHALFARGLPEAVPAMIAAWKKLQPRLSTNEPANLNSDDASSEAGGVIGFLVKSGDARAIDALWEGAKSVPVDVRIAIVEAFLPFPKTASSNGPRLDVTRDLETLPKGEAGAAIERLLASALDDTERCLGLKGFYNQASYEDPRVCDMAALTLSLRWPEKYPFQWSTSTADRDTGLARLRAQRRSAQGLPPAAPPVPVAIPPAKESDVAPLLYCLMISFT